MEPYDWSHRDRLQRDLHWDEDQRRLEDLRRDTRSDRQVAELGPIGTAIVFVFAGLVLTLLALGFFFGAD